MSRGFLQLSRLGKMGRWGNAIFQYLMGRVYSRRHDLQLQVPHWAGDELFGFCDARPDRFCRIFNEREVHGRDDTIIPNLSEPLANVDLFGYFQYHTSYFKPDREFIQSLFARPVDAVRARVEPAADKLRGMAPKIVGVHIRRGDYGQGSFYITPTQWYLDLLDQIVDEGTVVFVATENPALVDAFSRFNPVTAQSLGVTLSASPVAGCAHLAKDLRDRNAIALDFFPDWYLLQQCNNVVMPNSTFSFSAALTSSVCQHAYRSDPDTRRCDPIDVWDAMPTQFINQRDYAHVPGLYLASNPYW